MTRINWNSKSIEELWAAHEEIASILTAKMEAEKLKLENRLDQIEKRNSNRKPERRPYPKVYPRFETPTHHIKPGQAVAYNLVGCAHCLREGNL